MGRGLVERFLFSKRFVVISIVSFVFIITVPPLLHYQRSTDGGYTEWSGWSACGATCGSASRGRTRNCTNPVPSGFGRHCILSGPHVETSLCEGLPACPVNGYWNEWTAWAACEPNCKDGKQVRTRNCDNPPPSGGGEDCAEKEKNGKEERACVSILPCPINGGYGEFAAWSTCSASCGAGLRERIRPCNKPEPKNGGKMCEGPPHENEVCEIKPCVVVTTPAVNVTAPTTVAA